MTDQDRENEEFAWVRRAYDATPQAAPETVDAMQRAAQGVVLSVASVRRTGWGWRSSWLQWGSVGVAFAAAGIFVVVRMTGGGGGLSGRAPRGETTGGAPRVPASVSPSASMATQPVVPESDHPVGGGRRTPLGASNTPTVTGESLSPGMHEPPRVVVSSSVSPNTTGPVVATPLDSVRRPPIEGTSWSAQVVDGLDSESAVLVRHALDSAAVQGLPVTMLAARVREGVHRGVPGARIAVVVHNLAVALSDARATLGQGTSSTEIQAGAEALAAGAPKAALQQIRLARPQGSIAEPLVVLTDLTAHGVAPLQASAALAAILARDRSDAAVHALRARVVGDILDGRPPNAALADRVRQTMALTPSGQPRPSGRGADSLSQPQRTQ